jgi:hypothetical protein
MSPNELYFVVQPLIHLGRDQFGKTEEVLTLLPDRKFATEFFPDEVEGYISTFENRIKYLSGGHLKGYDIYQEKTGEGRIVVRVIQNVG